MNMMESKVLLQAFQEQQQHDNKNGTSTGVSIDSVKSAIAKMVVRTERFQGRVRKHIDDNNTEFMPNHTTPDMFLDKCSSLCDEIGELHSSVSNDGLAALNDASGELANSSRDLRELLLGLRVSEHILKLDDLFQCVEEAKATKDCLVVLDLMGKLRGLIYSDDSNHIPPDVERIFQSLECYESIKVKYHVQAHLLQQQLQERFDRLLQLQSKSFQTSKCVTLLVSKDESQLQDIVTALFQERYNPAKLCAFLLQECIEPLILKPVSVAYNEEAKDGTYLELQLSYAIKEPTEATSAQQQLLRPHYTDVFQHLQLLWQMLSSLNCSLNNGSQHDHVFALIGDHVKDRMLELLVEQCLIPAVPESMEEYQKSTLRNDVQQFEHFLADMCVINPDQDVALTKFARRFDTYYRNRLSARVLATAREIIQRDLQDMTLVAPNNLPVNIANDPFLFPRCMISKSAQDYVKLMDRTLRQPADNLVDDAPNPLSGVVGLLLEAYIDEVPKVHQKLLQSIPQQSALFHNNCMYLSHWIAQHASKDIDAVPSLVKMLQSTGSKYLRVQINYQESILMDIMSGFEFDNPHTLGTAPLKLVRQCLRQLELLKNVWQQVLPEKVYNSSFCELLHPFANELVQRVFKLRDISATMASELSDLIDVVLEKAPLLFHDPNEVVQVRSWQKLQQLKLMMNASLKEFTELWCDGAGPLTANYQANEIKHLIRALFQDTDRRAKAITQIV
ncbi:centromere/kinetochore protein zw10 [Drosophila sulfurigaster albostrigata]|uniref:centromere/kinetochore protein zw10 n=1 Tax=Drosophila sulfurigaster albostrigata TaxID=89887 RepID=UPI002D21ABEC|nr:centromere/kinetochore protein zw10 [Drosophila sulfurigaster albostrigata]